MTVTAACPTAVGDDPAAFATLVARHRRELQAHCRRMLGSPEQAEDALQEALLRAWRARSGFAGRSSARTWLYRIATNACLDEINRDPRRTRRQQPARVVALDDEAHLPPGTTASADRGPDVVAEARETLEAAFARVIALLPARQRAVLVLCEVLHCPAAEAAALLGTSIAAVTSALQRARATLDARDAPEPDGTGRRSRPPQRALVEGYVAAVLHSDVHAVVALARADAAGGGRP